MWNEAVYPFRVDFCACRLVCRPEWVALLRSSSKFQNPAFSRKPPSARKSHSSWSVPPPPQKAIHRPSDGVPNKTANRDLCNSERCGDGWICQVFARNSVQASSDEHARQSMKALCKRSNTLAVLCLPSTSKILVTPQVLMIEANISIPLASRGNPQWQPTYSIWIWQSSPGKSRDGLGKLICLQASLWRDEWILRIRSEIVWFWGKTDLETSDGHVGWHVGLDFTASFHQINTKHFDTSVHPIFSPSQHDARFPSRERRTSPAWRSNRCKLDFGPTSAEWPWEGRPSPAGRTESRWKHVARHLKP